MVTQLASSSQFIDITSRASGNQYRVNVTLRGLDMPPEDIQADAERTLNIWLSAADALIAGQSTVADAPEPVASNQIEHTCTVWGEVRYNAVYAVSMTVHNETVAQEALNNAIALMKVMQVARKLNNQPQEAKPAPKPEPPEAGPVPPPQNPFTNKPTQHPTQEGAPRLILNTKADVAQGETVMLKIARVESSFHNKAQVWQFFPELTSGAPGRYPFHALTIYADALANLPDAVGAWLQNNAPNMGDEVAGEFVVLAQVNIKDDRTHFNVTDIRGVKDVTLDSSVEVPF